MSNTEILDILLESEYDENLQAFKDNILNWDLSEPFPIEDVDKYIKIHQWHILTGFTFEVERKLMSVLPKYFLNVFFEMKQFRTNPRNELLSFQEVFAKLYNLEKETFEQESLIVYKTLLALTDHKDLNLGY